MAKLLFVEDNKELADTVRKWLEADNHVVDVAYDGSQGEDMVRQYAFDLIILDWKLPEKSGVDICKDLRAQGISTPVLMLTGKGEIADKLAGFNSGADDYLTKPFAPEELLVRVKALLRRPQNFSGSRLKVGELTLDLAARVVSRTEKETLLQRQEFALLEYFMRHPNQVIESATLLDSSWETDTDLSHDALYACVARLRKKLKSIGSEALTTVHGQGYLFKG